MTDEIKRAKQAAEKRRIFDADQLICYIYGWGDALESQEPPAARTAPPRKAYRCWFDCPTCKQEHEVQWETYEKPDFTCPFLVSAAPSLSEQMQGDLEPLPGKRWDDPNHDGGDAKVFRKYE